MILMHEIAYYQDVSIDREDAGRVRLYNWREKKDGEGGRGGRRKKERGGGGAMRKEEVEAMQ